MGAIFSYVQDFFEKYLTIPDFYISDIVEIIVIMLSYGLEKAGHGHC